MHVHGCLMYVYTDEVLGLRNTSIRVYNKENVTKRTAGVNRLPIDTSSTKLTTSTNGVTIDRESVNTIMSLSELKGLSMETECDNMVTGKNVA